VLVNPVLKDLPSHSGIMGVRYVANLMRDMLKHMTIFQASAALYAWQMTSSKTVEEIPSVQQ
jgi:hypothetical protein